MPERNSFRCDDGTPLNYALVSIKDWCKNSFELVNRLRISTDYSHHRYDVLLLLNGIPCVQIEKCVFVVDRKDLDRQTREEFNQFLAGCVEENTNTSSLVRRLLSDDYSDKELV